VPAALLDQSLPCVRQDDREVGVEAPVTMLRVYCRSPGVSAMMNIRHGVAK
jgi:hypothetical protein